MVVSNIIADIIISLSQSVFDYLKTEGIFIASGIIKDRINEVKDAIESNGFDILEILEEGEWCSVAAKRGVDFLARFCKSFSNKDEYIIIEGDDVKHISKVLRLKIGDKITISDGQGTDYECIIKIWKIITVEIISKDNSTTEPRAK